MEKMLNIVLFGPPGAGKGTQSENLINKYNLVHLSTGDILRSEIANGTELGKQAKAIMDRGELVGDNIVIGMIESKLDENPHAKGFIFDGFPRTAAQAVALDDLLQKKGTGISGMLALEVDNEELVKRLLLRGKDSGRADDQNEDIIRNRIKEYNNKTLPLKNYYSEQGKFHSIKGIGSIGEIFNALVDRITFIKAENDLTQLESDIEHLDMTIKDFDVADDIAPELLLEIDAIKRVEVEEEQEARAMRKLQKKKVKRAVPKKAAKKIVKKATKKKVVKKSTKKVQGSKSKVKRTVPKKVTKKIVKKTTKKKIAPKKVVKKSTKKLQNSKSKIKRTVPKKAAKKIVKKAMKKKIAPKKVAKKSSAKKKKK